MSRQSCGHGRTGEPLQLAGTKGPAADILRPFDADFVSVSGVTRLCARQMSHNDKVLGDDVPDAHGDMLQQIGMKTFLSHGRTNSRKHGMKVFRPVFEPRRPLHLVSIVHRAVCSQFPVLSLRCATGPSPSSPDRCGPVGNISAPKCRRGRRQVREPRSHRGRRWVASSGTNNRQGLQKVSCPDTSI
jgi:hypothetical protein